MTAILVFIIAGMIGVLVMSVRVIAEYERAVIFRLGRVLHEPKGPGLIFLIPAIDKTVRVSVRVVTMDIEPQDVISRDNVSLKVNAVLYFRVVQPIKAIVNVENFL